MNLYFQNQTLRPRLENSDGGAPRCLALEPRCGIGIVTAIVGLVGTTAATVYSFHKADQNKKDAAAAQTAFNNANRPAPLQLPNAGRGTAAVSSGGYSITSIKQDGGGYADFVSTGGKLYTPDQLLAAKGNSPGLATFLKSNGFTVGSDGTLITGPALAGADTTTLPNAAGAVTGGATAGAGAVTTGTVADNLGPALLLVAVAAGGWMILRKKT